MIIFLLSLILIALVFGRGIVMSGLILLTFLSILIGTFVGVTGIIWTLSFLLLIGLIGEIPAAALALIIAVPCGWISAGKIGAMMDSLMDKIISELISNQEG